MLSFLVLAALVVPPPTCPFFTASEAATVLGAGAVLAEVTPAEQAFPGMKIALCRYTGQRGGLVVTRTEFASAVLLKTMIADQRKKDLAARQQEAADRIAREKDAEELSEARDEPDSKKTKEEAENDYPQRIQEDVRLAGVTARYYAEPHNHSAALSAYNGLRGLGVNLLWQGKNSDEKVHRPLLQAGFESAARRL